MSAEYHVPVMPVECMQALNIRRGGIYFDGTLGGGGHSEAILMRGGTLIATDCDSDAVAEAKRRFTSKGLGGYTLVKGNFKDATSILDGLGVGELDGVILDLGISSHQIDDPSRGMSYRYSGELDMRMDAESDGITAADVVNGYPEERLERILVEYGEEKFARRIASAIVASRPIRTTLELAEIVKRSTPEFYHRQGHPAKKTFQAIRLEVNGELIGLDKAIEDLAGRLKSGGRMAVITFHSLEDRIVKQTFKLLATDCICDKSIPVCVCGHKRTVTLLGKFRPGKEELENNPRSASATLRVLEKI